MDVNTANILPLIWASKLGNFGLANLNDPSPGNSDVQSHPPNGQPNQCSNLTRQNLVALQQQINEQLSSVNATGKLTHQQQQQHQAQQNLWTAALSNDLTTSFKQLLANANALATSPFANSGSGDLNDGFAMNGNNSAGVNTNGLPSNNIQQALMARLGQAASILAGPAGGDPALLKQQTVDLSALIQHQQSQQQQQHHQLLSSLHNHPSHHQPSSSSPTPPDGSVNAKLLSSLLPNFTGCNSLSGKLMSPLPNRILVVHLCCH